MLINKLRTRFGNKQLRSNQVQSTEFLRVIKVFWGFDYIDST